MSAPRVPLFLFFSSSCPQAKYLALHTGHTEEEIMQDFSRPRYFNPYEAAEYGLIDQVRRMAGRRGTGGRKGGGGRAPAHTQKLQGATRS
jgi:hypothetical protein